MCLSYIQRSVSDGKSENYENTKPWLDFWKFLNKVKHDDLKKILIIVYTVENIGGIGEYKQTAYSLIMNHEVLKIHLLYKHNIIDYFLKLFI